MSEKVEKQKRLFRRMIAQHHSEWETKYLTDLKSLGFFKRLRIVFHILFGRA